MTEMLGGLKTLSERGPRDCCWPVGEPDQKAGQMFCGMPVAGRKSYCTTHNPNLTRELKPIRLGGDTRTRKNGPAERAESDHDLLELLA